jgi:hypothetical protein
MRCKDWVKEVKGASWVDWIMDKLGAQEQGLQQDADAIDEVGGLGWCALGQMFVEVLLRLHSSIVSNLEPSSRQPSANAYKQQCVTAGCVLLVRVQFVRELLQKSSAVACHSYSTQGIDKLLLSDPPVDEPGNVIDGMLHYRLYEVSGAPTWAYVALGAHSRSCSCVAAVQQ